MAYNGVALVVGEIDGQAGGDGLFKDGKIAGAGGIEKAGGEVDSFGCEVCGLFWTAGAGTSSRIC